MRRWSRSGKGGQVAGVEDGVEGRAEDSSLHTVLNMLISHVLGLCFHDPSTLLRLYFHAASNNSHIESQVSVHEFGAGVFGKHSDHNSLGALSHIS